MPTATVAGPDRRLKQKICKLLSEFEFADSRHLDVAVSGTTVALTGRTGTATEKRRAEKMIRDIPGVGTVKNNLKVRTNQIRQERAALHAFKHGKRVRAKRP